MISSLVHGPESLQLTEVENCNPNSLHRTKKVVDHKVPREDFRIGHNAEAITTLIPHFYKDANKSQNLIYVDVGGLNFQHGDFIQTILTVINRMIFNHAQSARFLILMPCYTLERTQSRLGLTKVVEFIEDICGQPLDRIAPSILPIVTQARVGDDYFDLPLIKMLVQQQVIQQFMGQSYLKRHFFRDLAEKVVVFDPLDRPLPAAANDQAIKASKLKSVIEHELEPVTNESGLTFPLSPRINLKLNSMMEAKYQKCRSIAEQYKE